MITNIIIGNKSFVTRSLLRFIEKAEVFSANNLDDTSLNKFHPKKKINLIFNNFYPSRLLNSLSYKDYREFEKLSLNNLTLILVKFLQKIIKLFILVAQLMYRLVENINNQKRVNLIEHFTHLLN